MGNLGATVHLLLLVENRDHDLHACTSEVFSDRHLSTRSDGLREDLFDVLDFGSDHYYEVMPQRIYYSCSCPLMPFHAEVLIPRGFMAELEAKEHKYGRTGGTNSSYTGWIDNGCDERTLQCPPVKDSYLSQSAASSGVALVDQKQKMPSKGDSDGVSFGSGNQARTVELVRELQRVADIVGGEPTTTEFREHGRCSVSLFYERFNSWPQTLLWEEVDLDDKSVRAELNKIDPEDGRAKPQGARISTEELLEDLRRINQKVGRPPRGSDIRKEGEYSRTTYRRRFGGMLSALSEAGIEADDSQHPGVKRHTTSIGELFDELLSVVNELGRPPTAEELRSMGEFTPDQYALWLGSWNEALEAAGLPLNLPRGMGGVRYYGSNWREERQRALVRDRYRCQDCGLEHGDEKERSGSGLNVHHLIPIADFRTPEEANFPENLITLCGDCHDKWEPLTQAALPDVEEFV